MRKLFLLFFTVLLINIFTCKGIVEHYGLVFHSHQYNQDERTGLNLNPGKSFNFSGGFSLEFDLKLIKKDMAYGYVCRIVSNDNSSFDLISNINAGKINLVLLGEQGMLTNKEVSDPDVMREDYWIKVSLKLTRREIICMMDTFTYKIPYTFSDFKNIKIYFGANEHPVFYTTDISPVTVRDIVIRNEKGEVIRNWILAGHRNKEVYDEIKRSCATVVNEEWVIDQYTQWKETGSIATREKNAQIATDSKQGRVFVATQDSLYIYHLSTNDVQRIKIKKGAPFMQGGSQLIYDNVNQRLISYSIIFPDWVIYDFETNEWSSDFRSEGIAPIQHHNRLIDPETGDLLVFGGYGNHTFKSELAVHKPYEDGWQIDSISGIPPRFLGAAGYWSNGKFLLMGGFGSMSGKQEESPKHFYDLYEIDFMEKKSRKLADFPAGDEPYTLGNTLVIDKEENKVYSLAYNKEKFHTKIYLLSVDMNNLQHLVVGEPVSYRFLDTESFSDLFLNKATQELYMVLLQGEIAGCYNIEIYSLRYPPLSASDVLQEGVEDKQFSSGWNTGVLFLFVAFAVAGSVWYYLRHKRSTPTAKLSPQKIEWKQEKSGASIRLLGGFQVFNKQGEDITGSFSLIMKQMFLLFLLNSIKNEKGITSQKLNETFWMGMNRMNATNNRGVNVRKLRLLLQEVGNITISNENSYWFLHFGDDINCDYYNAIVLMRKLKQGNAFDKEILQQLLDCTSGGALLPNTNVEWIDVYKADFSDQLINLLSNAAEQKEIQNDSVLLLRIVDAILQQDEINEFALKIKCFTLYKQGQKGLSKQTFDRFCTAYMNMLNARPNFEYENLIR
jgi:two-component SAPR family response regulator